MSDQPDSKRPDADIVPTEPKGSGIDASIVRAMETAAGAGVARTFAYTLAAILATHPAIGPYAALVGVADVFIGGGAQRVAEARAKRFAESIEREFAAVRSEMIRADYFETEDGIDLLMQALQSAVRVSDDKRRDAIARILVATASGNAPPNVEPVSLIAVLGEMSESEALVLGGMWRVMQPTGRLDERPGYRFFNELKMALPTVQMDGIGFVMARIARTGLTRSALAYDDELGNEPIYEFTPTGVSLMRFLNDKSPSE
jgi:hypothetical protein